MKTRHEDQRTAIQEALEMIAKGRPQDAAETLSAALEAPTDDEACGVCEEPRSKHQSDGTRRQWDDDVRGVLVLCPGYEPAFVSRAEYNAMMDAHAKVLSVARDAALGEAAQRCDANARKWDILRSMDMTSRARAATLIAAELRAMKSAPARRMLDAEEVRRRLLAFFPGLLPAQADAFLGVDLDAAPAKAQEPESPMCTCGHDMGWHYYGKKRGCMKKMPDAGNATCPCRTFSLVVDASR